jgi:stage V sporulation protein AA
MSGRAGVVFVLVKNAVHATRGQALTVSDLAELGGDAPLVETLGGLTVVSEAREHHAVSALAIVRTIRSAAPSADLQLLGATAVVINRHILPGAPAMLRAVLVGVFLFLGAGLAIINFHADVGMPAVLSTVHRLVVGSASGRPLALQISYSVGLGLGILLFFRGLGRPSREAGPLELEIEKYQRQLDDHYRMSGRGR